VGSANVAESLRGLAAKLALAGQLEAQAWRAWRRQAADAVRELERGAKLGAEVSLARSSGQR